VGAKAHESLRMGSLHGEGARKPPRFYHIRHGLFFTIIGRLTTRKTRKVLQYLCRAYRLYPCPQPYYSDALSFALENVASRYFSYTYAVANNLLILWPWCAEWCVGIDLFGDHSSVFTSALIRLRRLSEWWIRQSAES
jgi:hypothetical protein